MGLAHPPFAVTGFGIASSLGTNAALAFAATRAGLVRSSELPFTVVDAETNVDEPVIGHSVAALAAEFEGTGRVLRLAQLGLASLAHDPSTEGIEDPSVPCFLVLPAPGVSARENGGPRTGGPGVWAGSQLAAVVAHGLGARSGPKQPALDRSVIHVDEGQGGMAAALMQAMQGLQDGSFTRCIVGAADSQVRSDALRRLFGAQRLKTADQPDGLIPGEAAVFFVVETADAARRRRAPVLGLLDDVVVAEEPDHRNTEKPPLGRALAAAVLRAFGKPAAPAGVPWIVSDHNGEPYRAGEIGNTLLRLCIDDRAFQHTDIWYPALSFGDTGVAAAAVGLGAVLRAFARGYAPAPRAVVVSTGDGASRTAFRVHMPD